MSSLQIGRVLVGPPLQWNEQVGDPITNLGGTPIPQPRSALRHAVSLSNYAADGKSDTVASRLVLRRAFRSMLNNTQLKLQGFLYLMYSDDPEQNGWYVPDQGQLADYDAASGLATGMWKIENVVWMLAGHMRSNREARNIWMKDLRGGLWPRDALRLLLSTDFGPGPPTAGLPALPLSIVPHGATSVTNAVSGQILPAAAMSTGRDGGTCSVVQGLADLTCVSYDRAETALNLSDVIVYDRRGGGDAPASGPGTTWEEVYGPDYQWNWFTVGQPTDIPVLDNGLVRVRWDATSTPGFTIDAWTGSAYVEQGKMCVHRRGDTNGYCNVWVSANLVEYTPDRAVLLCVLAYSGDVYSREKVYITLQRGEQQATFEVYPAPKADTTPSNVALHWCVALTNTVADLNSSVVKIDSQGSGNWTPGAVGTAKNAATAGTGGGTGNSGLYAGFVTLGNANFTTSENWLAALRCPTTLAGVSAFQQVFVVMQAANAWCQYGTSTVAYPILTNCYQVISQNNTGYLQVLVGFSPTTPGQVLEGEAMALGTNTSAIIDATGDHASGSGTNTTTTTRTTDANPHVSSTNWPTVAWAASVYRVFARVKVSANTGSFYAKTGTTTGSTVTTTRTTYTWLDMGEIIAGGTLEIHAWIAAGGTAYVDRVEAYLVQDRVRTGANYSGARDQGQGALYDSRQSGALVSR